MNVSSKHLYSISTILFSAFFTFSTHANAKKCERVADLAYELQWDRQHGVMHDYKPKTQLEEALLVHVFQQPQYHSEEFKRRVSERFSREWQRACKKDYY